MLLATKLHIKDKLKGKKWWTKKNQEKLGVIFVNQKEKLIPQLENKENKRTREIVQRVQHLSCMLCFYIQF